MATYLLVDDTAVLRYTTEAKSISEAVENTIGDLTDSIGLAFDVYRIASGPKRVTIKHETVTRIVVE